MSVGILIVSHGKIGKELLKAAAFTFGALPIPADSLSITSEIDPGLLSRQIKEKIALLDNGEGVLILADTFGASHYNVCSKLLLAGKIEVITGTNLPMLLKICNYHQLPLSLLCAKAIAGGQKGIFHLQQPPSNHSENAK